MSRLRVLVNAGPWLPVPPSGYGGIETVVATLVRRRAPRLGADRRHRVGVVAQQLSRNRMVAVVEPPSAARAFSALSFSAPPTRCAGLM